MLLSELDSFNVSVSIIIANHILGLCSPDSISQHLYCACGLYCLFVGGFVFVNYLTQL